MLVSKGIFEGSLKITLKIKITRKVKKYRRGGSRAHFFKGFFAAKRL